MAGVDPTASKPLYHPTRAKRSLHTASNFQRRVEKVAPKDVEKMLKRC
jgi:hypothetical protein